MKLYIFLFINLFINERFYKSSKILFPNKAIRQDLFDKSIHRTKTGGKKLYDEAGSTVYKGTEKIQFHLH